MTSFPKAVLLLAVLLVPASLGIPAVAAGPAAAAEGVAAAPRPPSVSVVSAVAGRIAETVVVTGTLVPRREILVAPEIDGLAIVEILAEEGDEVAAGQVLARLSPDTVAAQLARAEAAVARADAAWLRVEPAADQAEAQIAEAEATRVRVGMALSRAETLQERGVVSAETLEERLANAKIADARLLSARQALRLARAERQVAEAERRELQIRLDRTEIRAPVAGIVSRRTARIGALASMAGDQLFRIIAEGVIELDADVPETVLAKLRRDQGAEVQPAGLPEGLAARVRLVSPEVDPATRLGRVRIALDGGPVPGLAVGAFGRAVVEVDRREDATLVPQSAVLYGAGGASVQVVKDGVVSTRPVRVGLRAEGRAEIREGLAPGEEVVSVSGTFVRDGDVVSPVRPGDGSPAKPGSP
jgi:HlyD family secretion protein